MITKKTVLVLGAGASIPYGYPSGLGLVKNILLRLRTDVEPNIYISLKDADITDEEIENFRASLHKSQQDSIDAFLEWRPEFEKIGKLAISLIMIPNEKETNLLEAEHSQHWYRYLFNKMNTSFLEFGNNKLSIITFNYDRSLEHYLFTALKNTHNKTDQDCAVELRKIPIVHIYGNLGPLPWQEQIGRPYVPDATLSEKSKVASGILTITEEAQAHYSFKSAIDFLSDAEQIIFLGFGYHNKNVDRLRIRDMEGTKIGSGFGLYDAEINEIKEKWDIRIPTRAYENLEFLRTYIKWESDYNQSDFMVL